LFAFLATAAFICLEKALSSEGGQQKKNLGWGAIFLALCTVTFLDAVVFLPYATHVYWLCCRREKKFHLKPILLYGGIVLFYAIVWIAVPLTQTYPWVTGNLMHILGYLKPDGPQAPWAATRWPNLKNTLLMDSVFISLTLIPMLAFTLFLGISKRLPAVLVRFTLLWSAHFIVWVVVMPTEHGHAMLLYPLLVTLLAYGFSSMVGSWPWTKSIATVALFAQGAMWLACFLYFDVSFDGRKSPVSFLDGVPRSDGVIPAHHVGLKTVSYILRKNTPVEGMVAANVGDVSFFYSGKKSPYLKMDALVQYVKNGRADIPTDQPYVIIVPYRIKRDSDYEALRKYAPHVYIRVMSHGSLVCEVRSTKPVDRVWEVSPETHAEDYDREFSGITSSLGAWVAHVPASKKGWVGMLPPTFGSKE
jgi:hypothetical protein